MHLFRNQTGGMSQSVMLGLLITVGITVTVPVVAQKYFGGEGFNPTNPLSGTLGDKVKQGKSIADMRSIATANAGYFLKSGHYANQLHELVESGYLDGFEPRDGWGNEWFYRADSRHFVLVSFGSDGRKGPTPPEGWSGEPWEADLIVRDGEFLQTPDRGQGFRSVTSTLQQGAERQANLAQRADEALQGGKGQ